ncbi:hypothetical protein IJG89_01070 [Candidatus Saccharibacteria bacterium]|nr:hypothetical protein [Candidatus Saccharibacteria bacterium]
MAQAKRKTATRTKKATQQRKTGSRANTRTAKKQQITQSEKIHVYIITAMAIVAGVLLCANAAMMIA